MVGFAMYEPRGNGVFSVHRLMIDAAHQNQGIGSWSMRLVMDTIVGLGGETISQFPAEEHRSETPLREVWLRFSRARAGWRGGLSIRTGTRYRNLNISA